MGCVAFVVSTEEANNAKIRAYDTKKQWW